MYKQINAPFGQLGMDSLKVSTAALKGGALRPMTPMYVALTDRIQRAGPTNGTRSRQEMKAMLDGAAFNDAGL